MDSRSSTQAALDVMYARGALSGLRAARSMAAQCGASADVLSGMDAMVAGAEESIPRLETGLSAAEKREDDNA